MRLARIEWGADYTLYLAVLFIILVLFAFLMERASPGKKKKSRRSIDANRRVGVRDPDSDLIR